MNIVRKSFEIIIYFISGIIPKKSNRIIFGSWEGFRYDDNSRFIFEYMCSSLKEKKLELIWIGNKDPNEKFIQEGVKYIEKDTLKSIYYILTSKYAFMTQGYLDFNKYNLLRNCVKFNLWHGIPIKKIGKPGYRHKNIYSKVRFYNTQYDYFISSSKENKEKLIDCFNFVGASDSNILECGQPRNDYILKNNNEEHKFNIKRKYNIDKSKIIVTYMPTFRDNIESTYSFTQDKYIESFLKKENILILEKQHHRIKDKFESKEWIKQVNEDISTQDLLLITDILITDYSSVYIDFLLINKPIIYYVYDKEYYINEDRGLFYKFEDVIAGPEATNTQQVKDHIRSYIQNPKKDDDLRRTLRKFFLEYEVGKSCDTLMNIIIHKKG